MYRIYKSKEMFINSMKPIQEIFYSDIEVVDTIQIKHFKKQNNKLNHFYIKLKDYGNNLDVTNNPFLLELNSKLKNNKIKEESNKSNIIVYNTTNNNSTNNENIEKIKKVCFDKQTKVLNNQSIDLLTHNNNNNNTSINQNNITTMSKKNISRLHNNTTSPVLNNPNISVFVDTENPKTNNVEMLELKEDKQGNAKLVFTVQNKMIQRAEKISPNINYSNFKNKRILETKAIGYINKNNLRNNNNNNNNSSYLNNNSRMINKSVLDNRNKVLMQVS